MGDSGGEARGSSWAAGRRFEPAQCLEPIFPSPWRLCLKIDLNGRRKKPSPVRESRVVSTGDRHPPTSLGAEQKSMSMSSPPHDEEQKGTSLVASRIGCAAAKEAKSVLGRAIRHRAENATPSRVMCQNNPVADRAALSQDDMPLEGRDPAFQAC